MPSVGDTIRGAFKNSYDEEKKKKKKGLSTQRTIRSKPSSGNSGGQYAPIKPLQSVLSSVSSPVSSANKPVYHYEYKDPYKMNYVERAAEGRRLNLGQDFYEALAADMKNPASPVYNPYFANGSTIPNVEQYLGQTSFDKQWLQDNIGLRQYEQRTNTLGLSGPNKHWTPQQWQGWLYNQIDMAEDDTTKAEGEWASLLTNAQDYYDTFSYTHGRAPTVEEFIGNIDMSKYNMLQKIDDSRNLNTEGNAGPIKFNRSIGYSKENLYGVYNALLNGKRVDPKADYFEDSVQYQLEHVPETKPQKESEYSTWGNVQDMSPEDVSKTRNDIRVNGDRKEAADFEEAIYERDNPGRDSYGVPWYVDQKWLDDNRPMYEKIVAEQHLLGPDPSLQGNASFSKPDKDAPYSAHWAYEYYLRDQNERATQALENEWQAFRENLAAGNEMLSNPEVAGVDSLKLMAERDMSDYPRLQAYLEGTSTFKPNRPVYASPEAVAAVIDRVSKGLDVSSADIDYALLKDGESEKDFQNRVSASANKPSDATAGAVPKLPKEAIVGQIVDAKAKSLSQQEAAQNGATEPTDPYNFPHPYAPGDTAFNIKAVPEASWKMLRDFGVVSQDEIDAAKKKDGVDESTGMVDAGAVVQAEKSTKALGKDDLITVLKELDRTRQVNKESFTLEGKNEIDIQNHVHYMDSLDAQREEIIDALHELGMTDEQINAALGPQVFTDAGENVTGQVAADVPKHGGGERTLGADPGYEKRQGWDLSIFDYGPDEEIPPEVIRSFYDNARHNLLGTGQPSELDMTVKAMEYIKRNPDKKISVGAEYNFNTQEFETKYKTFGELTPSEVAFQADAMLKQINQKRVDQLDQEGADFADFVEKMLGSVPDNVKSLVAGAYVAMDALKSGAELANTSVGATMASLLELAYNRVNRDRYLAALGPNYTLQQAREMDPILDSLANFEDHLYSYLASKNADYSELPYMAANWQATGRDFMDMANLMLMSEVAGSSFDAFMKKNIQPVLDDAVQFGKTLDGIALAAPKMSFGQKVSSAFSGAVRDAFVNSPFMLKAYSDYIKEARDLDMDETTSANWGAYGAITQGAMQAGFAKLYFNAFNRIPLPQVNLTVTNLATQLQAAGLKVADFAVNNLKVAGLGYASGLASVPIKDLGAQKILGSEIEWDTMADRAQEAALQAATDALVFNSAMAIAGNLSQSSRGKVIKIHKKAEANPDGFIKAVKEAFKRKAHEDAGATVIRGEFVDNAPESAPSAGAIKPYEFPRVSRSDVPPAVKAEGSFPIPRSSLEVVDQTRTGKTIEPYVFPRISRGETSNGPVPGTPEYDDLVRKNIAETRERLKNLWDQMDTIEANIDPNSILAPGIEKDRLERMLDELRTEAGKEVDRLSALKEELGDDEILGEFMDELDGLTDPADIRAKINELDEVVESELSAKRAERTAAGVSPDAQEILEFMEQANVELDGVMAEAEADRLVEEDIQNGALDDLTSDANASVQAIAKANLEVSNDDAEVQAIAAQLDGLEQTKQNTIATAVNNGMPLESGKVKQALFNIEEQKASLAKDLEKARKKKDNSINLQLFAQKKHDAEIAERKTELKKAHLDDTTKQLAKFQEKREKAKKDLQVLATSIIKPMMQPKATKGAKDLATRPQKGGLESRTQRADAYAAGMKTADATGRRDLTDAFVQANTIAPGQDINQIMKGYESEQELGWGQTRQKPDDPSSMDDFKKQKLEDRENEDGYYDPTKDPDEEDNASPDSKDYGAIPTGSDGLQMVPVSKGVYDRLMSDAHQKGIFVEDGYFKKLYSKGAEDKRSDQLRTYMGQDYSVVGYNQSYYLLRDNGASSKNEEIRGDVEHAIIRNKGERSNLYAEEWPAYYVVPRGISKKPGQYSVTQDAHFRTSSLDDAKNFIAKRTDAALLRLPSNSDAEYFVSREAIGLIDDRLGNALKKTDDEYSTYEDKGRATREAIEAYAAENGLSDKERKELYGNMALYSKLNKPGNVVLDQNDKHVLIVKESDVGREDVNNRVKTMDQALAILKTAVDAQANDRNVPGASYQYHNPEYFHNKTTAKYQDVDGKPIKSKEKYYWRQGEVIFSYIDKTGQKRTVQLGEPNKLDPKGRSFASYNAILNNAYSIDVNIYDPKSKTRQSFTLERNIGQDEFGDKAFDYTIPTDPTLSLKDQRDQIAEENIRRGLSVWAKMVSDPMIATTQRQNFAQNMVKALEDRISKERTDLYERFQSGALPGVGSNRVGVVSMRGPEGAKPGPGVIRIDRASKLGNPFPLKDTNNDTERVEVIRKYKEYFDKKVAEKDPEFMKALDYIVEQAKRGPIELACWCAPKPCHGDVIREYVAKRLARENMPASVRESPELARYITLSKALKQVRKAKELMETGGRVDGVMFADLTNLYNSLYAPDPVEDQINIPDAEENAQKIKTLAQMALKTQDPDERSVIAGAIQAVKDMVQTSKKAEWVAQGGSELLKEVNLRINSLESDIARIHADKQYPDWIKKPILDTLYGARRSLMTRRSALLEGGVTPSSPSTIQPPERGFRYAYNNMPLDELTGLRKETLGKIDAIQRDLKRKNTGDRTELSRQQQTLADVNKAIKLKTDEKAVANMSPADVKKAALDFLANRAKVNPNDLDQPTAIKYYKALVRENQKFAGELTPYEKKVRDHALALLGIRTYGVPIDTSDSGKNTELSGVAGLAKMIAESNEKVEPGTFSQAAVDFLKTEYGTENPAELSPVEANSLRTRLDHEFTKEFDRLSPDERFIRLRAEMLLGRMSVGLPVKIVADDGWAPTIAKPSDITPPDRPTADVDTALFQPQAIQLLNDMYGIDVSNLSHDKAAYYAYHYMQDASRITKSFSGDLPPQIAGTLRAAESLLLNIANDFPTPKQLTKPMKTPAKRRSKVAPAARKVIEAAEIDETAKKALESLAESISDFVTDDKTVNDYADEDAEARLVSKLPKEYFDPDMEAIAAAVGDLPEIGYSMTPKEFAEHIAIAEEHKPLRINLQLFGRSGIRTKADFDRFLSRFPEESQRKLSKYRDHFPDAEPNETKAKESLEGNKPPKWESPKYQSPEEFARVLAQFIYKENQSIAFNNTRFDKHKQEQIIRVQLSLGKITKHEYEKQMRSLAEYEQSIILENEQHRQNIRDLYSEMMRVGNTYLGWQKEKPLTDSWYKLPASEEEYPIPITDVLERKAKNATPLPKDPTEKTPHLLQMLADVRAGRTVESSATPQGEVFHVDKLPDPLDFNPKPANSEVAAAVLNRMIRKTGQYIGQVNATIDQIDADMKQAEKDQDYELSKFLKSRKDGAVAYRQKLKRKWQEIAELIHESPVKYEADIAMAVENAHYVEPGESLDNGSHIQKLIEDYGFHDHFLNEYNAGNVKRNMVWQPESVVKVMQYGNAENELPRKMEIAMGLSKECHEIQRKLDDLKVRKTELDETIPGTIGNERRELEADLGRLVPSIEAYETQLARVEGHEKLAWRDASPNVTEAIYGGQGLLPTSILDRLVGEILIACNRHKSSKGAAGAWAADMFNQGFETNQKRIIEGMLGQEAGSFFNAVAGVDLVERGNYLIAQEEKRISKAMQGSGINADNSVIAHLFGEGLITVPELTEYRPDDFSEIVRGLQVVRTIYDDVGEAVNKALGQNGLEPFDWRRDYFPHFRNPAEPFRALVGIETDTETLPLKIAGMTRQFKPMHEFDPHLQARVGNITEYGVLEGMSRYIPVALRVIYQTKNIVRLRQVIQALRNSEHLISDNPAQKAQLTRFITYLQEYTNWLCGKKTGVDAFMADKGWRTGLNAMRKFKVMTGSALTSLNSSVGLAQTVALNQILADNPIYALGALAWMIQNVKQYGAHFLTGDGFEATNEALYRKYNSRLILDPKALSFTERTQYITETMERFFAHILARSAYLQALGKGYNPAQARRISGELLTRAQSTRLLGEGGMPYRETVAGTLFQFAREPANYILYLVKDLKKRKGGIVALISAVFGLALNHFWNELTGKKTAFDPVGEVISTYQNRPEDENGFETFVNAMLNAAGTGWPYSFDAFNGLNNIPVVSALKSIFWDAPTAPFKYGDKPLVVGEKIASAPLALTTGGLQIERSYRGIKSLILGYSQSENGNVRFPLDRSWDDFLIAPLLGESSTAEGKAYNAAKEKPMSSKQDEEFYKQIDAGIDSTEAYNNVKLTYDAINATNDSKNTYETGDRTASTPMFKEAAAAREKITWPAYTPGWSSELYVDGDKSVILARDMWRKFGDTSVLPKQTPEDIVQGGKRIVIKDDPELQEDFEDKYSGAYQTYVGRLKDGATLKEVKTAAGDAFAFAKELFLEEHKDLLMVR